MSKLKEKSFRFAVRVVHLYSYLCLLSAFVTVQAQSPYIHRVYEYMPAPGQFVNTMPEYQEGDTQEDMNRKAEQLIAGAYHNEGMITLGGYGGYVVFGFDHAVRNVPGKYDFRILGNAFYADANPNGEASREGGSSEPGIVMVSRDANGNGLPDDPWYELAGSEYRSPRTTRGYRITYHRPDEDKVRDPDPDYPYINDRTYIRWTTNGHGDGYLLRNIYNTQPYYPQWINSETLTFEGARLADNAVDESGKGTYYVLYAYHWGYVDNHPNADNRSAFNIEWAVDAAGHSVPLDEIHFVKVYTALNQYCGWIGETSTEIAGAVDLHLTGGDASVPVFVSGITLNPATLSLQTGKTALLAATLAPTNAANKAVTWQSADPVIATVSNTGLVSAHAPGATLIRAIANDGYYIATCTLTVASPTNPDPDPNPDPSPGVIHVSRITLAPTTLSLQTGKTAPLQAIISPANATDRSVRWESLAPSIATVSNTGLVSAHAPGTTLIRATANDGGHTATCALTVTSPTDPDPNPNPNPDPADPNPGVIHVSGITLAPATLSLQPGETAPLQAIITPANATNKAVTWNSSNTAVAQVTVNGLVFVHAYGVATISALTVDGSHRAICALTVENPNATEPVAAAAPPHAYYAAGRLRLRNLDGYACTLFTAGGQLLQTFRIASPDETRACSLPKGFYLLNAQKDNRQINIKLVISRE
jgi:uncharacterized protein YjdB